MPEAGAEAEAACANVAHDLSCCDRLQPIVTNGDIGLKFATGTLKQCAT
jgi:hypothetical protein